METVRVRFAPSPTGYLHVGGARTALFNWLFARHHGGVFVLRIEDTDLARSTDQATQIILDALQYLGLTWDEGPGADGAYGPYYQSERLSIYRSYAEKLLELDRAYECYCSAEELEQKRKEQIAGGIASRYDRSCAALTAEEKLNFKQQNRLPAIRFKAEMEGETVVEDLIRGTVRFKNTEMDDFVIFKSDGTPTYNFAVVVDDSLMKISHVIRGEDHLSNTPKQIQIYQALGLKLPQFAHISMILGPDKALLSKRHGATSVLEYEKQGFLAEAMVNYLSLLGWGYDDAQTIFSRTELIEKFSLERVSKNPAVFDLPKLEWMNGVYIRELSLEDFYQLALPFWQEAGYLPHSVDQEQKNYALRILQELQSRIKLLEDLVEMGEYFFVDDFPYNEQAVEQILGKPRIGEILNYLQKELQEVAGFGEDQVKPVFQKGMEIFAVKMGAMIQPLRVALTGTRVSPGIYEVLELLGPEKVFERIERTMQMLKEKEMI